MKKILVLSVMMALVIFTVPLQVRAVNSSCSYTNTWDLVDGNKKIDYVDNSKYGLISLAQYQWTKYGGVKIQKDTLLTVNDLTVSDYYEVSGTLGYTSSNGIMQFNTYNFDNMTYYERFKTAMHELGHALGLAHQGQAPYVVPPVMSQGKFEAREITGPDKQVYLCNWG